MFQRHPDQSQQMMFITTNTKDRSPIFKDPAAAREAVEALYRTQNSRPFFLYAFVIMPDHSHFLVHIPESGSISKIIGIYKRKVSFALGRGPIWQSRFHIIIPKDVSASLNYIHLNPVRKGLCERPEDYPWSSASGRWDVAQFELF